MGLILTGGRGNGLGSSSSQSARFFNRRKGHAHEAGKHGSGRDARARNGGVGAGVGDGAENRRRRAPEDFGWHQVRQEDQRFAGGVRQNPPEAHRSGGRRPQEDRRRPRQARRRLEPGGQEGEGRVLPPQDGRVPAQSPAAQPGGPGEEEGGLGRI